MKKTFINLGVFISFFVYSYISYLPLYIFGVSLEDLSFTMRTIYLLDTNLIFLCILLMIYHKDFAKYYRNFIKNYKAYIKIGIKYWLTGLLIMIIANGLISSLTPNIIPENEAAIRDLLASTPWYIIISTTIFAPIIEETVCRKTMKEIFSNKWIFMILSAFVFGAAHVVASMTSWWNLLYIIPYGALGFVFAYAYQKTNNLFTPIIMHAIHNTVTVLIYLILIK